MSLHARQDHPLNRRRHKELAEKVPALHSENVALKARVAELEAALREMIETAHAPSDVRAAAIVRAQAAFANR